MANNDNDNDNRAWKNLSDLGAGYDRLRSSSDLEAGSDGLEPGFQVNMNKK
jgi:hypothetical protein